MSGTNNEEAEGVEMGEGASLRLGGSRNPESEPPAGAEDRHRGDGDQHGGVGDVAPDGPHVGAGGLWLTRVRKKLINNYMESLRIDQMWNGRWMKFIT